MIKDLRIGVRMSVGLAALMGLMLALFAVTLIETEQSRAKSQRAMDEVLQRRALIDEGKEGLLESAVAMRNIGLMAEVDAAQREEIVVLAQRKRLVSALRSLAGLKQDDEAAKLLRELQALEASMEAPVSESMALALAFSPEGAVKVITAKIDPLYRQSLDRMRALVTLESKRAAAIEATSAAAAASLRKVLLTGCSATLLLSAMIGWWLTRSVTLPIRQAVRAAHQLARGDLSGVVGSDRRDESGDLLRSLGTMADMLKTMLSQVRLSADSIAVATGEVAAGAVDLSSRTEETASQTQATVGVIDALDNTVLANADHTRQAGQLADTATGVARYGGAVVAEVVSTMARISESSKRIADITSVIDGIAFQTNILALNAAVEAARAGEQGRGFAVVASEVRALAQRSASAAREIKTLITASAQSVENGAALVDKAGGAMGEIVSSVNGFHDIIRRVSSTSDDQASGVKRVKSAIVRIDDATQRNAALVEQSAAASGSLQHQADQLRLAIGMFKV